MGDQQETPVEEIDLTEQLTEDQIRTLFDAFEAEDWSQVDQLTAEYEQYGSHEDVTIDTDAEVIASDTGEMAEAKAGGADRNRGQAEKLRRYWTVGEGAAKIRWGTDGDWTRCVEQLSKYLGPRAKGYCSLRHKEMNGYYPGSKLNKSDSTEEIDASSIYHESKQDDAPELGDSMIEHKAVGVQGMKVLSAEEGIVETIISVTGVVDNVKDRIMPGAYSKTLVKRKPKGVWSHDWDTPVSKTLDVKELMPGDPELPDTMPNGEPWPNEAGALKVKTQFNLETQRGREAYSDVVFFGEEQEWSIGYNVPVGGAKVDSKTGVREIGMLELYEYSPVLFGAMPLARTTSVKEAQLAMKALKGGAAAWLSDAKEDENEEVEEREAMEMEDEDYEGKAAVIDADQMILVKAAIDTLTELLEIVGVEAKADKPSMDEDPAPLDDEEYDEYDSLEEAVLAMIPAGEMKDSLAEAASDIDAAISDDDEEAIEKAVSAFLDVIEGGMGEDDDTDELLKSVAQIVGDMIDQIGEAMEDDDEKEPPSEETTEQKAKICPRCGMPMAECKCGDMDMSKKRDYSEATREEMAKEGMAMPDGSYPIKDRADLQNAIQAFGRAKDKEATKKHIMKRARDLDAEDMIPEAWTSEKTAAITVDEIKAFLDSIKS